MIIEELFDTWEDGTKLIKRYSDQGLLMLQEDTGMLYPEAIDIETSGHTYVETDQYCDSLVQEEHDAEILKSEIEEIESSLSEVMDVQLLNELETTEEKEVVLPEEIIEQLDEDQIKVLNSTINTLEEKKTELHQLEEDIAHEKEMREEMEKVVSEKM